MITRSAVSRPSSLWADLTVLVLLGGLLYGVIRVAQGWQAPLEPQMTIDLSLWALPGYTVLSLFRGFAAYGLSLGFSLVYGYCAAHHLRAERVLIPLLDIFQSIPVLGFLPGAVLTLVALFPRTTAGLELACILMIFTGQVWNIAFSFYQSLRSLPPELQEVCALYQFNWWQRFRRVELPASAASLAWNSMMAMAGGWFFLMVCEAFTLSGHDFRLPGLGAYLSVAIAVHDHRAILGGLCAMVLMIVLVDACVWRPVLLWTQRFRREDANATTDWGAPVLHWLRRSWLVHVAMSRVAHPISEWLAVKAAPTRASAMTPTHSVQRYGSSMLRAMGVALAAGLMAWAAWHLGGLVGSLRPREWAQLLAASGLTLARVIAAVVLGSLWTIPIGIWIGRSDRWRSRLQPLVQVAASFPAPILYPLIVLALHRWGWSLGTGSVLLMLLGTQWYLLFNVIAGASAVPDDLREVASAYQFTARQRWRTMWLPAILPYLITGWVTAAGGAWNASIVAEYVSFGRQPLVAFGLGSLISVAASQGRYELLAAGVLTMAVIVVLINRYVWKPLYRVAETRYAC